MLRLSEAQEKQDLQDPRLLILEGIRRGGGDEALLAEDLEALAVEAPRLREALVRHPGLEDVVRHVQTDVALFDRCWAEQFDANDNASGSNSAKPSADRAPRRDRAPRARTHRSSARWVWRVGALAAIAVFAVMAVFLVGRESGLETLATGPDEVKEVTLADGSHVRLMPNSELEYHADENEADRRFVRLKGNAFFEIVPDREGFKIDMPTAVVVVLGTSFGIQASEDVANVYLATGRLAVTSQDARSQPVVLDPGETTAVRRGELPAPPQPTDVTAALSWTGLLVFNETPVLAVTDRLSEAFGMQIEADARLQSETITGTFDRSLDGQTVLDAVASALNADVSTEGGRFIIQPR